MGGIRPTPGIGIKTAKFFVLHSRAGEMHGVLDTHVLSWMRDHWAPEGKGGPAVPRHSPQDPRAYRFWETVFFGMVSARHHRPPVPGSGGLGPVRPRSVEGKARRRAVLAALDQLDLVALGGIDECDDRAGACACRPVAQLDAFLRHLRGKGGHVLDLKREVHQVRLHLHRRAVGQLAGSSDLLVARWACAQTRKLRAARRRVPASNLSAPEMHVLVEPHWCARDRSPASGCGGVSLPCSDNGAADGRPQARRSPIQIGHREPTCAHSHSSPK